MLQQRRKDYLQRIIEEFFKKIVDMRNDNREESVETKKKILNDCFQFFFNNFGVNLLDTGEEITTKIENYELSEQYANLLVEEFELEQNISKESLHKALAIVDILEKSDTTYSWQRTTLKQDILRLLSNN